MKSPSPVLFLQTLNAFQASSIIRSAVELDVVTLIEQGATTVSELATHMEASERGTRILCDALVVLGFLMKQDNKYSATLDSATFLNRKSKAYLGDTILFIGNETITESFRKLTTAVRKGGTAMPREGTVSAYTFAELEKMFVRAGFSDNKYAPGEPQQFIVSSK